MNILSQIVASKKREIEALRESSQMPAIEVLSETPMPLFYQRLAECRAAGKPFFITEFKRKSPSESWINREADLPAQLKTYIEAGANAISVLTDEPFFGGTYSDLALARKTIDALHGTGTLLLQKDFILDPIQIHLAKQFGADLILLIAAILEPDQLDFLRKTAESIGLGVLVEVHDAEELDKIQHLDFQVLGVNNRDLKTFRTALNRVNTLRKDARERFLVAESGVLDARHFQMVRRADAFLIGTGLMRRATESKPLDLATHFGTSGRKLFKACGIRDRKTLEVLGENGTEAMADFVGINFSPHSKRRPDDSALLHLKTNMLSQAVAVFYQNSEAEIRQILADYAFKTVQFYAGDVSPAFVRSLKLRVMMAVKVEDGQAWQTILNTLVAPYAADVDCFILDGAVPGSGARIEAHIPADFPYPFLLAGGLHEDNLAAMEAFDHCIGVDIASGIETDGLVDPLKIAEISRRLRQTKA